MEKASCFVIIALARFAGILTAPVDLMDQVPLCAAGEFWSNGICIVCTSCEGNMETIEMCTENTDTVCKCPTGSFLNARDGQCQTCRICPNGSQVTATCSANADTQCSDCPSGSFYDPKANLCQMCGQCTRHEVQLRPCTAHFDTVCVAASVVDHPVYDTFSLPLQNKRLQPDAILSSAPKSPSTRWQDQLLSPKPFYYLVLAIVIFVFTGHLIIQVCRSYERTFSCPSCCTKYTPANHAVQQVVIPAGLPMLQQQHPIVRGPGSATSQLSHDNQMQPPPRTYCALPLQQSGQLANSRLTADHQPPVTGQRSRLCSTSSSLLRPQNYPGEREKSIAFDGLINSSNVSPV